MVEQKQDQHKDNPYSWYDDMVAGAKRERSDKDRVVKARLKSITDKAEAKRNTISDLMSKAAKRINDEQTAKRDKEIAKAKEKAITDIETAYESNHNVKSEQTKRLDNAWKSLSSDLLKK